MKPSAVYLSTLFGFALGAALWLAAVFAQLGGPTESSRWIAEVYDRKTAAANRVAGPKLLVVSGSNGHFGVRAEELAREAGMPAVNFATHAGLGLDYVLHRARGVVRRGDVVVMPIEYELYVDDGSLNVISLDYLLARDPAYLRSLPLHVQLNALFAVAPDRVWDGLVSKYQGPKRLSTGYQAETLNPVGDETANDAAHRTPAYERAVATAGPIAVPTVAKGLHPHARARLAEFARFCREAGATMVVSYPSTIAFDRYHTPEATPFFQAIRATFDELGVPVVGEPKDTMYERAGFFDTRYHLTREMASVRTRTLMSGLRPYLKKRRG
ncbi:hypothetical protein D3C72_332790 [compost metagenome]